MPRSVHEGFEEFLRRLTPLPTQRAAAAAHRSEVGGSLKRADLIHDTFETGSFSHGTGVRHHSDVDVLAEMKEPRPESSDTALRLVQEVLAASFPATAVRISRPAVVVEFAGGDETWEVIPGYITGRGGPDVYVYDIPGASSGWMDSAPEAHLEYVTEANNLPSVGGGAKKLARLLKAWKYYNGMPVSSFYLEMRATEYVLAHPPFVAVWDLAGVFKDLVARSLAPMNDPSAATGRFHACSSEASRRTAFQRLKTDGDSARLALDAHKAGDDDTAFRHLGSVFVSNFPPR